MISQIVGLILGLLFSYQIYKNRTTCKSLQWVTIGLLLLNAYIIVVPFPVLITIDKWLILSLFLVELYQYKRFAIEFKEFPLKQVLVFVIFCAFIIGFFDERLSLFDKFYNSFTEVMWKSFVLFLGYFATRSVDDLRKILKPLSIAIIIVALYGLFQFIMHKNPYLLWVANEFGAKVENLQAAENQSLQIQGIDDRYRVYSTFWSPFDYGFVSALMTILFFAIYNLKNIKNSNHKKIIFIAGMIGVLLCGSRAVLLCTILSLLTLILFATSFSKRIMVISTVGLFFLATYSTVPYVQEKINGSLDILKIGENNSKLGSSSLEMRYRQLIGTFVYFAQSPIVGNGYDYISNELGWKSQTNLDNDLLGFESIIFQIMIEQGIVGLLAFFVFCSSIILFFIKNLKWDRLLSGLGLAIFVLFLGFIISTGPQGSWLPTMLVLGIIIKTIVLQKQQINIQNTTK
jgi:hypothetical protein